MSTLNLRPWQRAVALLAALLILPANQVLADSKERIDKGTQKALVKLREHSSHAGELLDNAAGVLVFPDIFKMGFGVGGEFVEGSLLIDGEIDGYYAIAGASFGLQIGAQVKSEVLVFTDAEALKKFRSSRGWKVGVDGSVALVKLGAGGSMDSMTLKAPVVGFIFSNKGLMYNLTMEGNKITPISR